MRLGRVTHMNAVLKRVGVRYQAYKPRDSDKYAPASFDGKEAEALWITAPIWGPELGLTQPEQQLWAAVGQVRKPAGGQAGGWAASVCKMVVELLASATPDAAASLRLRLLSAVPHAQLMPMLKDPCLSDAQRKVAARLCVKVGIDTYRLYPTTLSDYVHTLFEHSERFCRQGRVQRYNML